MLARARGSGGSLLGRAVALLGWLTGQRRRSADPSAYLLGWRRRGTLGRVLNPVRAALVEAAAALPPAARPAVRIPRSAVWPVVGALQLGIGAIFVLALAWYVTLFVAGGQVPVAVVELPLLGPLPMPLVLLAGSVLASALLGWLVGLHAGVVGRRLAARVTARVVDGVRRAVTEVGFGGLARVEAARRAIADAVASAE